MRRAGCLILLILTGGLAAPSSEAGTAIRGHTVSRSSHHHHGGYHGGYHGYYRPYGYYGYPYYGPYGYYPYAYYRPWWGVGIYAVAPTVTVYGAPARVAFVDTDVSPEEAEVWLNGEYAGTADDFDGYPQYLTVPPGENTITFRMEGTGAARKDFTIRRGETIRFKFRLPKGGDAGPVPEPDPPAIPAKPEAGLALEPDEGPGPGFMDLRVAPADASVYIDGEFFGTAETLAGLHGALRLESGEHLIEVVRPGYRTARRTVSLHPGDRVTLSLELAVNGN